MHAPYDLTCSLHFRCFLSIVSSSSSGASALLVCPMGKIPKENVILWTRMERSEAIGKFYYPAFAVYISIDSKLKAA